ncbi:sensor histidine kinase [Aquibacillus kalidii]|uniref:sensor histidine kinase n=1 Tax=Aquibacillus kalidii TaxID=2762597 RepID=UPI0016484F56|nr:GHKL domain-containing protein [Aquibacillus kalidii]
MYSRTFYYFHIFLFLLISIVVGLDSISRSAVTAIIFIVGLVITYKLYLQSEKWAKQMWLLYTYLLIQLLCSSLFVIHNLIVNVIVSLIMTLLFISISKVIAEKISNQKKLETLMEKVATMDDSFRVVRAQRHDFMGHVSRIDFLVSESRFDEGKEYLAALIKQYQLVNSAVKGEEGHAASVLLTYQKQAEHVGSEVSYQLDAPISQLPIPTVDQVSLLSNLLTNAIEAASEHSNKQVQLHTSIHRGLYILELTNTTLPLPNEIADNLFKRFDLTSKQEHHEGLGTYIIHEIVTSNMGHLEYKYEAELMEIKIKFPMVER